jgi:hypothetical protein
MFVEWTELDSHVISWNTSQQGDEARDVIWRDFWMDEGGRNRPGDLTPWQHCDDDDDDDDWFCYFNVSFNQIYRVSNIRFAFLLLLGHTAHYLFDHIPLVLCTLCVVRADCCRCRCGMPLEWAPCASNMSAHTPLPLPLHTLTSQRKFLPSASRVIYDH